MSRSITTALILALAAAACSGGDGAPTTTTAATTTTTRPAPTTTSPPTSAVATPEPRSGPLIVWVDAAAVAGIEDAADDFAAFEVVVEAKSTDEIVAALTTRPASGPDVFLLPHDRMTLFLERGTLEPLGPVADSLAESVAATVTRRGIAYGAPLGLDAVVQVRNPALADAVADVTEFAAACTAEDEEDPGPGVCLALPAAGSGDIVYPFLVAGGGYVFGSNSVGEPVVDDLGVDSNSAIAGVSVLEEIIDAGTGTGVESVASTFAAGETAFAWVDAAGLATIAEVDFEFVVEALPQIDGLDAPTPLRSRSLFVNALGDNKVAAVALVVEHLATADIAGELGLFSPNDEVVTGAVAHPVPAVPEAATAWTELGHAMATLFGGQSASQALTNAEAALTGNEG